MIWGELTRRQQLWILRWQDDTMRDLLSGPTGDDIRSMHASIAIHLAPLAVSTTPIPLEAAVEIERVAGLPSGSLRPYGRVPDHDELDAPAEGGLHVIEEPPFDAGPNLPSDRLLSLLATADRMGVDRGSLVRAANLDHRMLAEAEEGVRCLVASGVVDRAARSLGQGDAALLPDARSPYILYEDAGAGRRFVLRARMTAARAEAIRSAVCHCGAVDITPSDGPSADPVAIRLDVVVDDRAGDALIRALFSR